MTLNGKFSQGDKAVERLAKTKERELLRAYSASLKEIRLQLAVAYEKYGGSLSEMNKYNRLSSLESSISKEVSTLTKKTARTLKTGVGEVFKESFYRTAFALETTVQAKLGFTLLPTKAIDAAIQNPLDRYGAGIQKDSLGFLMRNRANQQVMIQQINQEISQGLIQGESYGKVAKRVKERLDIGASKALRIAQTEAHRCQVEGRLKGLQQAESKGVIMKKQWVSAVDDRTRSSHQDLDGVTIPLDDDFQGEDGSGPAPGQMNSAAEDVNCRCSMIGVIEGYEPEVRRVRGEGVIPYTNYNDYYKDRIKK